MTAKHAKDGFVFAPLDGLCDFLAKDRPLALLLLGSFAAACVFCLYLFDVDFLLGRSAFWNNPRGIVGHSWADISNGVSGYAYFQRDSWHLPLFHVGKLGAPAGTNITYTDGVPWVSLAGRLVFQASGVPVNLLGAWTAFCFVASAMTFTALVATLGQRNLAGSGNGNGHGPLHARAAGALGPHVADGAVRDPIGPDFLSAKQSKRQSADACSCKPPR